MKKTKNNLINLLVIGLFVLISNQSFAQAKIWRETFEASSNLAWTATVTTNVEPTQQLITDNGQWTLVAGGVNGVFANNWIISPEEVNTGASNCSQMGSSTILYTSGTIDSTIILTGTGTTTTFTDSTIYTTTEIDKGNTLFIGLNSQLVQEKTYGAFFSNDAGTNTDLRIVSPIIDLTGKKDIEINFDYLLGAFDNQTHFIVSYYNGSSWVDLPTLPNTYSEMCPAPRTSKWANNPVSYMLPSSVANIPNFQLGFRFINEPVGTVSGKGKKGKNKREITAPLSTNYAPSVAIDNIIIVANDMNSVVGGPGTGENSTLRVATSSAPITAPAPSRKIEFTVYPNPNSGQFTVDFSGIENNHEVVILLSDASNGNIIYKTSFLSQSIEHNKVNITPDTGVTPGKYICTLVFEEIRLGSTVIIH